MIITDVILAKYSLKQPTKYKTLLAVQVNIKTRLHRPIKDLWKKDEKNFPSVFKATFSSEICWKFFQCFLYPQQPDCVGKKPKWHQ